MSSMPRIFTVLELSVPGGEALPKVRKAILAAGLKLSELSTKSIEGVAGVALESIPNNCESSDWEFQDAELVVSDYYAWISMGEKSVALVHDLGQTVTIHDIHQSEVELEGILYELRRADPSIFGEITFQADEA